jgi:L-arabinokinase
MNHFEPSWLPGEGAGILHLLQVVERAVPVYFAPDRAIQVARAPGRLDVMGGIADYSGSLVLQLPLSVAACVAVQRRDDDQLHAWSPCRDGSRSTHVALRLSDLGLPDHPIAHADAQALFAATPRDRWAAYVLGAVLVLARDRHVRCDRGLSLLLSSDVPEGKGVSSSAACEVAAMRAIATLLGCALTGRELAVLCQRVENLIAGAPCGVMDQMAAACGEEGKLMALRCQPCELEGHVAVPSELELLGLDSGVRHAVTGSDYAAVRAGAFMGQRILADVRGLAVAQNGDLCAIDDPEWRGYLANADVLDFRARFAPRLPETITGAAFLARYGGTADPHTRIDPARLYAVRVPTWHPVEENARVERFRVLLAAPPTPAVQTELGDLMFASHASYSACGLGSEATDWIVDQVRERRDAGAALCGAKITGGGSGGTVAILGAKGKAWYEVLRIKKAMIERFGPSPEVFRWSSPGAMQFGSIELVPRKT